MERDARLATPVRPVLHEKSVAVLPFENLNSGNSDEPLVNGDSRRHLETSREDFRLEGNHF